MFQNYLKIALRNLFRLKFLSVINISGLAIGMASCLLMLIYVYNETSYEDFHKEKDRIYRLPIEWGTEGSVMKFAGSMAALAPAAVAQIPEIEKATRVLKDYDAVLSKNDHSPIQEEHLFFADSTIFDIFSFQLLKGNPGTALSEPYSIVLSESMARKYFGEKDPMGQILKYDDMPMRITGVMADIPKNTHLFCQLLISYSTIKAMGKYPKTPWTQWGDTFTYILLKNKLKTNQVQQKLNTLLLQNTGEWFSKRMKILLQPLTAIHWDRDARGDIGPKGNKLYVYLFLTASFLVLLIACFNFMNLTTSHLFERMKEVGVRKVIGANRTQLIVQFLSESFLITFIALVFALVLVELSHSFLNEYLGKIFILHTDYFSTFLLLLGGMMLTVGLFSGGYPALLLSRHKPVDMMKRDLLMVSQKFSLRKLLVVLQFAISSFLILGTIMIYRQISYMKNSDLGFQKEDVFLVDFPFFGDREAIKNYSALRNEFLKIPEVVSVSGAYTVPGINSRENMTVQKEGSSAENAVSVQTLPADFDFVTTMGLKLVAGRDFSREHPLDARESVLLNETAVKTLGLENPIGTRLQMPKNGRLIRVTVVGVVKDFHIRSMHKKITPMLIYINPEHSIVMAVRVRAKNARVLISHLKETWNRILPNTQFNYRYMADAYDRLYQAEEKSGRLLSIFTALALFISCLGLLGLISLMTTRRIKEIGIRKVLGASTIGILTLFIRQFGIWVLSANVLAWPFGYYLINRWLQNFAYHASLRWWMFIVTGFLALIIALVAVSTQAVKAAIANPVESLRYE